jgi:hypothetical protein
VGGRIAESRGVRFTTLRLRRLTTLPPLVSLVGHRPRQLVNCFSPGKAFRSAPASVIAVCTVQYVDTVDLRPVNPGGQSLFAQLPAIGIPKRSLVALKQCPTLIGHGIAHFDLRER